MAAAGHAAAAAAAAATVRVRLRRARGWRRLALVPPVPVWFLVSVLRTRRLPRCVAPRLVRRIGVLRVPTVAGVAALMRFLAGVRGLRVLPALVLAPVLRCRVAGRLLAPRLRLRRAVAIRAPRAGRGRRRPARALSRGLLGAGVTRLVLVLVLVLLLIVILLCVERGRDER